MNIQHFLVVYCFDNNENNGSEINSGRTIRRRIMYKQNTGLSLQTEDIFDILKIISNVKDIGSGESPS
jgi:hypothetical protein